MDELYEIREFVTISTAHVPHTEMMILEEEAAYQNAYGVLLHIPTAIQNEDTVYTHKLCLIFKNLGLTWLRLDRDGSEYDHLPTFDW